MGTFTSLTTFQRLNIHKFQPFLRLFKQREHSQVSTVFSVQAERTVTGFNHIRRSSRENIHRFQPFSVFKQREQSQVSTIFDVQAERTFTGFNRFQRSSRGNTNFNPLQCSSRGNIHKFQPFYKFQPFSAFKQREHSQVPTVFNVQAEGIQILTLVSVKTERTFTSFYSFQCSGRTSQISTVFNIQAEGIQILTLFRVRA